MADIYLVLFSANNRRGTPNISAAGQKTILLRRLPEYLPQKKERRKAKRYFIVFFLAEAAAFFISDNLASTEGGKNILLFAKPEARRYRKYCGIE